MPSLKVGTSPVTGVKIGNTDVQKVYVGSNVVWSRRTHEVTSYFKSGTNNSTGYYREEAGFVFSMARSFTGTYGTITPNTFIAPYHGGTLTIVGLYFISQPGAITSSVFLRVDGGYNSSLDWTELQIGNNTYNKTAAIFTRVSSMNDSVFEWRNRSNPFGTGNGTSHDVIISKNGVPVGT